tara:strand:+ start:306 stop:632 length:327 start_codon:yes stop_codon:yes gene_type:complete
MRDSTIIFGIYFSFIFLLVIFTILNYKNAGQCKQKVITSSVPGFLFGILYILMRMGFIHGFNQLFPSILSLVALTTFIYKDTGQCIQEMITSSFLGLLWAFVIISTFA